MMVKKVRKQTWKSDIFQPLPLHLTPGFTLTHKQTAVGVRIYNDDFDSQKFAFQWRKMAT